MQATNWDVFRAKFSGQERPTFEWFCYLLFCREYELPEGVARYENHAGIETNPVVSGSEVVGWQAKFFDTSIANRSKELKQSITVAKTRHADLTKIIFYLNKDFGQHPKQTDPGYKTQIEDHALSQGVKIEWRTSSFFESPFVTVDNASIAKHFFSLDPTEIDLVAALRKHTEVILERVHSDIIFRGSSLKLDRTGVEQLIRDSLNDPQPLIVSGDGGVGKTAIIKDLFDQHTESKPLFLFKAIELRSLGTIDAPFALRIPSAVNDLANCYPDVVGKSIVIDSAEKISEYEDKEPLRDFLESMIRSRWKIIFTTRNGFLDDLKFILLEFLNTPFTTISVQRLEPEELVSIAARNSFALPANPRVRELIRNPFYLGQYLSSYGDFDTAMSLAAFRQRLWDRKITDRLNSGAAVSRRREDAFIQIATERATSGNFFVQASGIDESILEQLLQDEIIGRDANARAYFIAHDVYEEWALGRVIDSTYIRKGSSQDFFSEVGDSLPVRRAFRLWLSEKLGTDRPSVGEIIEMAISGSTLPSHWKDEILVSILLSEDVEAFFRGRESMLTENGYALLVRLTFLLRIACKSVDEEILKVLSPTGPMHSWHSLLDIPKGGGWSFVISLICREQRNLGLTHSAQLLPVMEDWCRKNHEGATTRDAGKVALFYYELLAKNERHMIQEHDEFVRMILSVVKTSAMAIKAELAVLVEQIVGAGDNSHKGRYHAFAQGLLGSALETRHVAQAIPQELIRLAELMWLDNSSKSNRYSAGYDLDHVFGLVENHQDYFPESAYQTPMLMVLRSEPVKGAQFLVNFMNRCADTYKRSEFGREVEEIVLTFPSGEKVTQIASDRLWCAYRGTQVSTNLIQSLHMALETWLLELVAASDSQLSENMCLFLLKLSRSTSITAVVLSVVLACQDKLFKVAEVLFRTKEVFRYDVARFVRDQTQESSLLGLQSMSFRSENKFFETERIEAARKSFRNLQFEDALRKYQFFRSQGVSQDESDARQQKLWAILDDYYKELPKLDKETDGDKTWRLTLARLDRRKMEPVTEEEDGRLLINFNPTLDPELLAFSEESMRRSTENLKYFPLRLWSEAKWKRDDEALARVTSFDGDIHDSISECQVIITTLTSENRPNIDLMTRAIPATVCAVALRDHWEDLSAEESKFCCDVVQTWAAEPLRNDYTFSYGEGVDTAILALPLVIRKDETLRSSVMVLLILLVLDGFHQHIGELAWAASAYTLSEISPSDAEELLTAYLLLAPKHATLIDEYRQNGDFHRQSFPVEDFTERFLEENTQTIELVLDNKEGEKEAVALDALPSWIIERAFTLLPPKNLLAKQRTFAKGAVPLLFKALSKGNSHQHLHKARLLKRVASYLSTCASEDVLEYLSPLRALQNFPAFLPDLIDQMIYTELGRENHDTFWVAWKFLYSLISEKLLERPGNYDATSSLKRLLLTNISWTDSSRQCEILNSDEQNFFGQVCKELGHLPATLFGIAKLLSTVGSLYSDAGIGWTFQMVNRHGAVHLDDLDPHTVTYLETFIRRYIFGNRERIKRSLPLRQEILAILEFLVLLGSVSAYLAREDVL